MRVITDLPKTFELLHLGQVGMAKLLEWHRQQLWQDHKRTVVGPAGLELSIAQLPPLRQHASIRLWLFAQL